MHIHDFGNAVNSSFSTLQAAILIRISAQSYFKFLKMLRSNINFPVNLVSFKGVLEREPGEFQWSARKTL